MCILVSFPCEWVERKGDGLNRSDWAWSSNYEVLEAREQERKGRKKRREVCRKAGGWGGGGKEGIHGGYLVGARENHDVCMCLRRENPEIQKLSQELWSFTGNNLGEIAACLRFQLWFGFEFFYIMATAESSHTAKMWINLFITNVICG